MKLLKWFVAIALVSFTTSGLCVTNGTLDNNRHPEVGTIVADYKTPGVNDQACSGTLISPTVFLTAGHCVAILQSKGFSRVGVTFDPVFNSSATPPYSGTMRLNPAFPGTGNSDPEDLGIVVLDNPVVGITPASLPTLGLLDRMFKDGTLKDSLFTIVGYGATDTVFGGGSPDATQGKGTRRYAIEGFSALNQNLMKLNMNTVFGFGGSNSGDSGGPDFLGAGNNETSIVVAIVYSGDRWGTAQDDPYRLDTPEARLFLGQYVILP